MTFLEWFKEQADAGFYHDAYGAEAGWDAGYTAGRKAERERIRSRVQIAAEKTWRAGYWQVGPQHNMIEKFVEELLREGYDT